MAHYRVREEDESVVSIQLTEVAGNQDRLLEAFGACQAGSCSCPTDEYDKLDGMTVEAREDEIRLRLTPKPGERFDLVEISGCLDYTTSKAAGPED